MNGAGRYQVVLGSDVVYSTDSVRKLFETVDRVLDRHLSCAVFVLSYVSRWKSVDHALVEGIRQFGFIPTSVCYPNC